MNRIAVHRSIAALFSLSLFCAATALPVPASAEGHAVKDPSIPDCPWSKLNSQQYKYCKAEQKKLEAMTPAERDKYLHPNGGGSQPPAVEKPPAEGEPGNQPVPNDKVKRY